MRSAVPRLHRFVAWVVWLPVLLMLTYKQKVLGQSGVRPLYLPGLALGFLYVFGYALSVWRKNNFTFGPRGEGQLLLALLAIVAYVTLQAGVHPHTFRPMIYATVTVALVFYMSLLTTVEFGAREFLRFMTDLLMAYSLVNFAFLGLGVVRPDLVTIVAVATDESGFGARLSGLPGDPTHLGALLSITLLMMIVMREHYSRTLLIAFAVPLLGCIVVAGSRNSILCLVLGCIVSIVLEYRLSIGLLRFAAGLMALFIGAIVTVVSNAQLTEFAISVFRIDDPNAYSRLSIWRDMFEILASLPLLELVLGNGFLFIQDLYGSPYNAFLRVLFNHGLLILLLVVVCVYMLLVLTLTEEDSLVRKSAGALLVYWIAFSISLDTFIAEFFHLAEFCFWLAAALLLRGAFVARVASVPAIEPAREARA
jgi:hypothetical protein